MVAGKRCGLHAQKRILVEPSFPKIEKHPIYVHMNKRNLSAASKIRSKQRIDRRILEVILETRKKGEANAAIVSEKSMNELFEVLFAEQKRRVRDPKSIQRGNHANTKKRMSCFNFERSGCAIRRFIMQ